MTNNDYLYALELENEAGRIANEKARIANAQERIQLLREMLALLMESGEDVTEYILPAPDDEWADWEAYEPVWEAAPDYLADFDNDSGWSLVTQTYVYFDGAFSYHELAQYTDADLRHLIASNPL